VPALRGQNTVSEQQDLNTCSAPSQDANRYNLAQPSLTSMGQKGATAFSSKILDLDNAEQDHNKCQPLYLRFHRKHVLIVKL